MAAARNASRELKVHVSSPWVRKHEYTLAGDATAADLKKVLSPKGVSPDELHVFTNDKRLPDAQLLREHVGSCNRDNSLSVVDVKRFLTRDQLLDVYAALVCCRAVYHESPVNFLHRQFEKLVPLRTISSRERCVNGKTHYLTAKRADKLQTIVAFRGTTGFDDVVADIKIPVAIFNAFIGGVHRGFLGRANEVGEDILSNFAAHLNRGMSLVFTGHSLGAAIACLTACNLVTMYPQLAVSWIQKSLLSVIGFGSPWICDLDFVTNNLGELKERCLFVINSKDIVPRLLSACSREQQQHIAPTPTTGEVSNRGKLFRRSWGFSELKKWVTTVVFLFIPRYGPFGLVLTLDDLTGEIKQYDAETVQASLSITVDAIRQHFANRYCQNLMRLMRELRIEATPMAEPVRESCVLHGHPATLFTPHQVVAAAALLYIVTGNVIMRSLLQKLGAKVSGSHRRKQNASVFARLVEPGVHAQYERARAAAAIRPREFWNSDLPFIDGTAEKLQSAVGMNNGNHPSDHPEGLPEFVPIDQWLSLVDDQLYAVRLLRWAIDEHDAQPTADHLRSVVTDPTAFAYPQPGRWDWFRSNKRNHTITGLLMSNVELPSPETLHALYGRRSREDAYLLRCCERCDLLPTGGTEPKKFRFNLEGEHLVVPESLQIAIPTTMPKLLQLFEQVRPFAWNAGISFSVSRWPVTQYLSLRRFHAVIAVLPLCIAYYYGVLSPSMLSTLSWEVLSVLAALAVVTCGVFCWVQHCSPLPYRDYVGLMAGGRQGSLVQVEKSVKGLPVIETLSKLRTELCQWYTVAVCGMQQVGKSTLCECLTGERFRPHKSAKTGHDLGWATITRDPHGRRLRATFIDLPGMSEEDEGGDAVKRAVARCACVCIVVVDIQKVALVPNTTELEPTQPWMSILEIPTPAHVVILLNKVDTLNADVMVDFATKRRDAVALRFPDAKCYLTSFGDTAANRIPSRFRFTGDAAQSVMLPQPVNRVYINGDVKPLIQAVLLDVNVSAGVLY